MLIHRRILVSKTMGILTKFIKFLDYIKPIKKIFSKKIKTK